MQQMPAEGRRFKAVDTSWRRIIDKLMKNPEVLVVGTDEDLLKNLKEANKQLDMVQKGLNEYLETKRLAFPRFAQILHLKNLVYDFFCLKLTLIHA